VRMTAQTGAVSIAVGPVQYDRDKNGQWTQRQRIDPFVFPKFDMAVQATNAKLGRQETLSGEPAQIVRFKIPDANGPGEQFAEWISTKDHRLLQLAMVAPSHFMMQYYVDYDSLQIAVTAPPNVQVATPAPTPVTAGTPIPPVFNGRNLAWGSALVLLVGAIVLGLLALNRKESKRRRMILLALGLLAILGSVGLFIYAATARPKADVTTNAPGKPLYDANCATCHGNTGHGDGPAGKSLPVTPFDLTTHVLLHDEQYLDAVITNGRGYMPSFKDQLTQDQIYQIIAYTRLLALKAQQNGTR
jgi:mono/diheme cytochrome c family protein